MPDVPSPIALSDARDAVVILPVLPEQPFERKRLGGSGIVADRATTSLTWWPDTPRGRKKGPGCAWLPAGTGAPEATVAAVIDATFRVGDNLNGLSVSALVFVSETGAELFRSHTQQVGHIKELWPPSELARLNQVGVSVRREHFATAKELNDAYPGAAGGWLSTNYGRGRVLFTIAAIVVVCVIAALLTLVI